mmetsp:Transcript_4622/g.10283  ORF Transcript_4622/g.10283 Transcript_4622/m.10283 type:complete len:378 (-) Transcript_4622:3008-4141(-)
MTGRLESYFGVYLKAGRAARIEDIPKFINTSVWPYSTPHFKSSVFNRIGFHLKCWLYIGVGLVAFFVEHELLDTYTDPSDKLPNIKAKEGVVRTCLTLISFVLSAYISLIVQTYWVGARQKARVMTYACSDAVDIISVTLDYSHQNANALLNDLHGSLTLIGLYSLAIASRKSRFKLSRDQKKVLFEDRGLDAEYMLSLSPRQCVHVLRWAILQSIRNEKNEGCFQAMSPNDWSTVRNSLQKYCEKAFETQTALESSKLPFAYFQLVNWATHCIAFFLMATFYSDYSYHWYTSDVDVWNHHIRDTWIYWQNFAFVTAFNLVMLYFMFGCLEVYHVICSHIWDSGLVLESYEGRIGTVCEPLKDGKPKEMAELKVKQC